MVPVAAVVSTCLGEPLLQTHSWLGRAAVLLVIEHHQLWLLLHTVRRYFLGAAGALELTVQKTGHPKPLVFMQGSPVALSVYRFDTALLRVSAAQPIICDGYSRATATPGCRWCGATERPAEWWVAGDGEAATRPL